MKLPAPLSNKPGSVLEYSIWLDGRETPEDRQVFELACKKAMERAEEAGNLRAGPLTFTEKKPGENRVPKVPDHIQGPDVRLLVCEAMVLGPKTAIVTKGFVNDLDPKDLLRLREITRMAHAKANPKQPKLTDAQCDAVIEQLGIETALATLRDRRRTVH